jgi:peptidoglycan/xylan/chitin deacetylase (PgdA/CDA1 family)
MSAPLQALSKVRDALPPSARRAVRRATDPVLAPVGSVAGVRPEGGGAGLVGLTFDDGPDPEATPAVLDALAAGGATATFFVLVDRGRDHPDLVRRARAEGHEIGLHGPDHRRLTTLGRREVLDGLRRARADLEAIAGAEVRWFRPPFGSQSPATYLAARRAGLVPVVWTAEGEDWVDQPPEQVAATIMGRVRPGGMILLHDGLAGDPREPATPDPLHGVRGEIVAPLLEGLAAAGLRGVPVGELAHAGRLHRTAWFRP